jgi:heme/copper-type cytochrome/quinol oxidase subunit 2
MAEYACSECREAVSDTASKCPHCGYTPAKGHKRKMWLWGIPGVMLTFSVVGIPLGVPMLWIARRNRKKAEKATPAVPA